MPYKDKEKRYQVTKNWKKKHPENVARIAKRYNVTAKGQNTRQTWYLQKRYGLTLEDYERMLLKQDGHCAVCPSIPKKRRLAVDHNHKTGKIRGLLCYRCNYSIGYLRDSSILARRIADYLDAATKAE